MSGTLQEPGQWESALATARAAPRHLATDITLVIPTLGRPILAESLGGLLAGSEWPGVVIVVDQGARPEVERWIGDLCSLGIDGRYVACSGRGRALGLNTGLGLADTAFVVITDDDCVPDARWIEEFGRWLRASPDTVFTGRVLAGGEERVLNVVTDSAASIARRPGLSFDRLSGGNCGMSTDILRRVGLFDDDPRVRCSEDGEWAYRALRAGVPIAYAPELAVTHVGWRDRGERLDQYRDYARSHAAFFGKHLRRGDLFMLARAGMHLARALRRWLRGLIRRDAELAANGRSYAGQFFPGIIAGMSSPRRPPRL